MDSWFIFTFIEISFHDYPFENSNSNKKKYIFIKTKIMWMRK
jgi:hypothetical protein